MKTLFFGTPALAVPYLELLAEQTDLQAVVTTPDEPAGRGYDVKASAVKAAALKRDLPVLQPDSVKNPDFQTLVQSYTPDFVLVVAYGKILPPSVLKASKHGFMNVHFSLLPAYRGAAPIQRALMNGEKQTGVTLFWLDQGMDTGPVFSQKRLTIQDEDDAESLRPKLIELGLEGVKEALPLLSAGKITSQAQTGTAIAAPPLKKEEGLIQWERSAESIVNLIRGTNPWPGASTFVSPGGKKTRLKLIKAARSGTFPGAETAPTGSIVGIVSGKGFIVKCGQEFLHVLCVQPEGKRPMSAWDYWQGARLKQGEKLG